MYGTCYKITKNKSKRKMAFAFNAIFFVLISSMRANGRNEQYSIKGKEDCISDAMRVDRYDKASNEIYTKIQTELRRYSPCSKNVEDIECLCHANVIRQDLHVYRQNGVTKEMVEHSAKYGTRYKILNKRLYRDADCMFPARCTGIEFFLLKLLPDFSDINLDIIINTRDWPQLPKAFDLKGPVFSFSKTNEYHDIIYPAWTFWAGGPAITLYPTGIGRWDLMRENMVKTTAKMPWAEKLSVGFFRGSRTSDERDVLVLLSRRKPDLVDAKYTKNQAWKSPQDTLHEVPAKEVSFAEHCRYKYLFNFRGVAASFRFKHLFLCRSLVFHVGNDWNEFFYFALKPWVHYIPVSSYPGEQEIEDILLFFQKHDALAEEIAERGYEFVKQHLRMQDIECYWKNLLFEYKQLLTYNVSRNDELIEIKAKNL